MKIVLRGTFTPIIDVSVAALKSTGPAKSISVMAAFEGASLAAAAKSSNLFNLGETITDIKTTLNDDELPIVLADGVLRTSDGKEFEYEQDIKLSGTSHRVQI